MGQSLRLSSQCEDHFLNSRYALLYYVKVPGSMPKYRITQKYMQTDFTTISWRSTYCRSVLLAIQHFWQTKIGYFQDFFAIFIKIVKKIFRLKSKKEGNIRHNFITVIAVTIIIIINKCTSVGLGINSLSSEKRVVHLAVGTIQATHLKQVKAENDLK